MKISVIVPVYNNEETVLDALDSVISQSRFDLIDEIIVINDGSKDNSMSIIDEYMKLHISVPIVLINQSNRGAAVARNVGIRAAHGDWIALLDADDVWLHDKIEKQVNYIEESKNVDFLGGNHCDKPLKIFFKRIEKLYKANIKDLCIKWFPVTPSVLFKKRIIDEIGGFNETMKYAEDGEFFARVCIKYNYYYMPEKVVSIGHGKRSFGERGLSANLYEMYRGNVVIFRNLRNRGEIGFFFYYFIRIFAYMKYLRRSIIININHKEKALHDADKSSEIK